MPGRLARRGVLFLRLVALLLTTLATQAAEKTHRLEATPQNVVIGYFDAHAKPVLHIASGDVVEVETLITSTPEALERHETSS